MTAEQPVLIAGAGIGGLATALALARQGIASHVVERRAELSEAGAGIQLSPNAVRCLELVGVAPALAADVGAPASLVVHDGLTGRQLRRLPLGEWIARRHGAPYWVAHRRDLQAALAAAVRRAPEVRLETGFEVRWFAAEGDVVRLVASTGARVEGRALVAADGVFSRIRQQLLAPRAPRWSGMTAARTVVAAEVLASRLDTAATGVWLARGAHVVHYPVRGGREVAVVVIAPGGAAEQGWALEAAPESVLAAAAGFSGGLREALAAAGGWRRWSLYELEGLPRWSLGRVTLLGDAAHPTLPFLAQGAALALEDAVVLAACLGEARRAGAGGSAIDAALQRYEAARMARATRVVAAARRNGRIFHLPPLAARARNLLLGLAPPERLMARWDWVYGWRPDTAPAPA